MLYNPKRSLRSDRSYVTPAAEARRLRLDYNRLQRRLDALQGQAGTEQEAATLLSQIERIARELGHIRADSVHAVESKLRVAMDLMDDGVDDASHKLLSSALADLHYLAVLSEPKAAAG